MKHSAILSLLGLGATLASAHMEMIEPAPFRGKNNEHATQKDFDMTSPLSADGANFPCKGYLSDVGTPAGASVATYAPGQSYKFTISGGASHNGGSCQASLSYDKGKTWTVIHSYIGNCPLQGESSFDFTIPADTPSGEAIFSWSWFNKVGNREMYQNCAAVTIGGGKSKRAASDSFKSRPAMFVANVGNGCGTTEGKDLEFPDPGPDVTKNSQGTAPPTGSCAGGSGGGSGGGSEGGNDGGNTGGNDGGNGGGNEGNPGIPSQSASNPGIPTGGAGSSPAQPSAPAGGNAPNPGIPTNPPADKPSATIPGGVFITSPATGGSGDSIPPPATTMLTVTNPVVAPPAETPGTPDAEQPPVEEPPATQEPPSTPAPTPGTGGGAGAGAKPQGEACTNEGEWNCVGGTQFQRCASGQWSALIAMASGTHCQEGISTTFQFAKSRRDRAVRFARSLRF